MTMRTAFMFPGQGAYLETVFTELAVSRPEVRTVFAEIDEGIIGQSTTTKNLFEATPSLDTLITEDPDTLQLALYGTAVAIYRILVGAGARPDVLVGHSLGEIAALVSAGALTVGDGAMIVAHRNRALRSVAAAGGMLAVVAGEHRVAALLDVVGDPELSLAAVNGARQVVISGPSSALQLAAHLADRAGIATTPIRSPYPFHSPLTAEAAVVFEHAIRNVPRRPLRRRVYSPILGRYYTDDEDFAPLLASHLTRRVHFAQTLQLLYGMGIDQFVECGAGRGLTGIVGQTLPGATTIATVVGGKSALDTVAEAVRVLSGSPVPPPTLPHPASPPSEDTRVRAPAAPEDRDVIVAELASMYAHAVEYPPDVFTSDVDLEADLGIDSLKQTELMTRVAQRYNLPTMSEDIRIADYGTLGRIADLILAQRDAQLLV